jgi:soluble lytic murein transglycosylase-like protein
VKVLSCSAAVVRLVAIGLAAGAGLLGFSYPARAELYVYTDADGVTHFSNIPTDARYQSVSGEPGPEAKAPALQPAPVRSHGRERFALLISQAAAETMLPESLLHAVIATESNYNPDAISRKGAVGLMQLMPQTAQRYGVANPRDPAANVLAGARYLKSLLVLFDYDIPLALAAYNAGPAAVMRSGRALPPYAETRRYVPRVMDMYRSGIRQ